jgi:DNA-binding response OmpR family regulator
MMDVMDHILIVDDDRDIRDLLSEYLQKQGWTMKHQLCASISSGSARRSMFSF